MQMMYGVQCSAVQCLYVLWEYDGVRGVVSMVMVIEEAKKCGRFQRMEVKLSRVPGTMANVKILLTRRGRFHHGTVPLCL
jgi:hypothetical protein